LISRLPIGRLPFVSSASHRLVALLLALVLAYTLASAVEAAGASKGGGSRPPKVIQVSYDESNDGSSPRRALYAFVRHPTDSVRFATRYHGRRATGDARYRSNITDTDIRGQRAKHPWALIREGGGGRVLRFIHRSLGQEGIANVRVRARRDGALDDVRVRIVRSQCAQDPPLYPLTCEVRA
jgi:hypothetical protein